MRTKAPLDEMWNYISAGMATTYQTNHTRLGAFLYCTKGLFSSKHTQNNRVQPSILQFSYRPRAREQEVALGDTLKSIQVKSSSASVKRIQARMMAKDLSAVGREEKRLSTMVI
jgi:hypothetical protein